jgi:hypothetical protein
MDASEMVQSAAMCRSNKCLQASRPVINYLCILLKTNNLNILVKSICGPFERFQYLDEPMSILGLVYLSWVKQTHARGISESDLHVADVSYLMQPDWGD